MSVGHIQVPSELATRRVIVTRCADIRPVYYEVRMVEERAGERGSLNEDSFSLRGQHGCSFSKVGMCLLMRLSLCKHGIDRHQREPKLRVT